MIYTKRYRRRFQIFSKKNIILLFIITYPMIKFSKNTLLACFYGLVCSNVYSQPNFKIQSPDKKISLSVNQTATKQISYNLKFGNEFVVENSLVGFELSKPSIKLNTFSWLSSDTITINEIWKPIWGEVSEIRNHYKKLVVHLKSTSNVLLDLEFRVFNEGLGFRYYFPEQADFKHFIVKNELTQFNLSGNHKTFWIPGDYDTNEYLYNTTLLSEIDALKAANQEKDIALQSLIGKNSVQTPLMLKSTTGLYINIHEAALINYPVMHLDLDKTTFTLTSHLTPDAVGNKAYLQTPFNTPWRVINVSNKAEKIMESKMILNLNEPSKIADPSWIKPQKFIGMWWEMHVGKSDWFKAGGKHGANTENVKKYIDFASENNFDGVLVEGWNQGWEDWFGNWKEDVFDFVSPYDDYNVKYTLERL